MFRAKFSVSACNFPLLFSAIYEASCEAYRLIGSSSGYFSIDPDGSGPLGPMQAYCNMTGERSVTSESKCSNCHFMSAHWEQRIKINIIIIHKFAIYDNPLSIIYDIERLSEGKRLLNSNPYQSLEWPLECHAKKYTAWTLAILTHFFSVAVVSFMIANTWLKRLPAYLVNWE